jgi:ferritin
MDLSKKMEKALVDQMNREFYSAHMYLAVAAYFETINMRGSAHWMKVQAKEETSHAMSFFEYIVERNGAPVLGQLAIPPKTWKSPLTAFQEVLKHEKEITKQISTLVKAAKAESDYATDIFLQDFVKEQVEEENSVVDIINLFEMVKDSSGGRYMLDRQLGKRTE